MPAKKKTVKRKARPRRATLGRAPYIGRRRQAFRSVQHPYVHTRWLDPPPPPQIQAPPTYWEGWKKDMEEKKDRVDAATGLMQSVWKGTKAVAGVGSQILQGATLVNYAYQASRYAMDPKGAAYKDEKYKQDQQTAQQEARKDAIPDQENLQLDIYAYKQGQKTWQSAIQIMEEKKRKNIERGIQLAEYENTAGELYNSLNPFKPNPTEKGLRGDIELNKSTADMKQLYAEYRAEQQSKVPQYWEQIDPSRLERMGRYYNQAEEAGAGMSKGLGMAVGMVIAYNKGRRLLRGEL